VHLISLLQCAGAVEDSAVESTPSAADRKLFRESYQEAALRIGRRKPGDSGRLVRKRSSYRTTAGSVSYSKAPLALTCDREYSGHSGWGKSCEGEAVAVAAVALSR
jgi:hypothetical protein